MPRKLLVERFPSSTAAIQARFYASIHPGRRSRSWRWVCQFAFGSPSGCRRRAPSPDAALGADASPMAGEQRATEQVRPNGEPVVAPLVAFRADARKRCSFGEEWQLDRLDHPCGSALVADRNNVGPLGARILGWRLPQIIGRDVPLTTVVGDHRHGFLVVARQHPFERVLSRIARRRGFASPARGPYTLNGGLRIVTNGNTIVTAYRATRRKQKHLLRHAQDRRIEG